MYTMVVHVWSWVKGVFHDLSISTKLKSPPRKNGLWVTVLWYTVFQNLGPKTISSRILHTIQGILFQWFNFFFFFFFGNKISEGHILLQTIWLGGNVQNTAILLQECVLASDVHRTYQHNTSQQYHNMGKSTSCPCCIYPRFLRILFILWVDKHQYACSLNFNLFKTHSCRLCSEQWRCTKWLQIYSEINR